MRTISCHFSFEHSIEDSGQGAISLLVFNDLDADAQTQAASPGHYLIHIRPSLPKGMRAAYSMSRVVNYPLRPKGICPEQIRSHYEWIF
jgi:hypothetical protein